MLYPLNERLQTADIDWMQKLYGALTKLLEFSLFLLDRTWVGSCVEAIIGKAVVASALFASLRYIKGVEVNCAVQRQAPRK